MMFAPSLYRSESSDPRHNAQRNLMGRTHYADPDTLRFHKSRILSARVVDNGLLFAITTSDALDMNNTRRGFRYVIFDLFGNVISRNDLEHAFTRHEQAIKAMWAELDKLDAPSLTLQAIEDQRRRMSRDLDELAATVSGLAKKAA